MVSIEMCLDKATWRAMRYILCEHFDVEIEWQYHDEFKDSFYELSLHPKDSLPIEKRMKRKEEKKKRKAEE